LEKTLATPLLRLAATAEEFPPPVLEPHATTLPSVLSAANAVWAENTSKTPLVIKALVAVSGAPPPVGEPQHATAPPVMMAANAPAVDWMRITFATVAEVVVMDPPNPERPQETTEPPDLSAAKAVWVEKIFTTPEVSEAATAVVEPPFEDEPHATTLPSVNTAAKAE
jgi:hypothetical protein